MTRTPSSIGNRTHHVNIKRQTPKDFFNGLLDVHENSISDISSLAGLGNLRHLNVHDNAISDISALSGLNNLETLIICLNQIHDISALSGLLLLSTLNLECNYISDISVLSSLSGLRDLNLRNNQIADISPLTALISLQSLDLRGNQWNTGDCDTYIPQILANNPGVWLQHECGPFAVSISSTPGGSVLQPGEGLFAYRYGESIRLEARANPHFCFAGWSGSFWSMQNPDILVVRQDHQIQANFVSTLDIIHVDDDGPSDPRPGDLTESDPGEDGTIERPFDQIQEAIEVAREGATIMVHAGTYRETVDLLGKSLTLTGFDPADPSSGGAWPVLDGGGAGTAVVFTQGEDPNCTLTGFVITGGKGRLAGAILCSASSPTISNCLIAGNRATDAAGGAVYCMNGDPALVNCTIVDNHAGQSGAGLYLLNSHVNVLNSILWGNGPREIVSTGIGGASVSYSDVEGGWEGPGCIHGDPLFASRGYWARADNPLVVVSPEQAGAVWVMGDYHLKSEVGRWDPRAGYWAQDTVNSPCIDRGAPNTPVGREPPPNGNRINIGVYGGTSRASMSVTDD